MVNVFGYSTEVQIDCNFTHLKLLSILSESGSQKCFRAKLKVTEIWPTYNIGQQFQWFGYKMSYEGAEIQKASCIWYDIYVKLL